MSGFVANVLNIPFAVVFDLSFGRIVALHASAVEVERMRSHVRISESPSSAFSPVQMAALSAGNTVRIPR